MATISTSVCLKASCGTQITWRLPLLGLKGRHRSQTDLRGDPFDFCSFSSKSWMLGRSELPLVQHTVVLDIKHGRKYVFKEMSFEGNEDWGSVRDCSERFKPRLLQPSDSIISWQDSILLPVLNSLHFLGSPGSHFCQLTHHEHSGTNKTSCLWAKPIIFIIEL